VHVSFFGSVNASDGIYTRTSDQNDYPVYSLGQNNFAVPDIVNGINGYVAFTCETCGGSPYTLSPTPSNYTCFQTGTVNYTLNGADGSSGNITIKAPSPPPSTLGYVTAQDSDLCLASVSEVHVSFFGSVNASDGIYTRTSDQNDYPVYSLGQNNFAISNNPNGFNNYYYVAFTCETCGEGSTYMLSPRPSNLTCFQNGTFSYNLTGAGESGYITMQAPPPPSDFSTLQCPECKQVLDGPLKNIYELESENDPRCEDGCLYSDPEGELFCFELDGQYQTVLQCPA